MTAVAALEAICAAISIWIEEPHKQVNLAPFEEILEVLQAFEKEAGEREWRSLIAILDHNCPQCGQFRVCGRGVPKTANAGGKTSC